MTNPSKPGYPDDNPKTSIGVSKAPLHYIPPVALVHLGLAMENGGGKYGLMNWREFTVSSSVYYDAMLRHLMAWWDGEDAAPDSKVHHLGHVMACAAILLDAAETTRLNDDRPDIDGNVSRLMERVQKSREGELTPTPAKIMRDQERNEILLALRGKIAEGPGPVIDLSGLAARESIHGAPTPKPPEDANNDDMKLWTRSEQPRPGSPRMRLGLSVKAGVIYFEDTPLVDLEQLSQLYPSQRQRLIDLVNNIDGDPVPVRLADVHQPEG
jgi:hypothetical protein